MKRLIFAILIAFVLWTVMFVPFSAQHLNFWVAMSVSATILISIATVARPSWPRDLKWSLSNIALGVAIAVVLWGVFWVGDKVSQLIFDFARPQVDSIYAMKDGSSASLIAIALLLLIGPAEEIFWRGYVQRTLSQRWGANIGFVIATAIYTLVHIGSLNFMLIMSAMVCGIAWGLLYRLMPNRFTAIMLSHSLWDVAVFVLFPIM
jgi:membrane protease YdiL (CAAX protease family)